jgi:hexosaminidase
LSQHLQLFNISSLSGRVEDEVVPAVLSVEEGHHVLGAQANLWSEYLLSPSYLQRAVFPRADALAEAVWTPPAHRSWSGFLKRLPAQIRRYRRQGITPADSAFAVDFRLVNGRNGTLQAGGGPVALENQAAFGRIHYTLDGSEPDLAAKQYISPLGLKLGTVIKAAAFSDDGMALAAPTTYELNTDALLRRSSNETAVAPARGEHDLCLIFTAPTSGPLYVIDTVRLVRGVPDT